MAQLHLNDREQKSVLIELYADGVNGIAPERAEMNCVRQLVGAANGSIYSYSAGVPAVHQASDYTARIIPRCDSVAIPLENSGILWQR